MDGVFTGCRAGALCALTVLASCAETTPRYGEEVHAVEAALSAEMRESMAADEAFAQVYSVRPSGSVEAAADAITFEVDKPFALFVNPDPEAIAYELRITQGNARVASLAFEHPAAPGPRQLPEVTQETTVEADVLVNAVLEGSWCEACTLTRVRHFVSPRMAEALTSAPRAYHVSVAKYARGVSAGIQAWVDRLATSETQIARLIEVDRRMQNAYADYEARLVEKGVEDADTARAELEHSFVDAHLEAGFDPATLAVAAQESTELMIGWFSGLDLRVVPYAIYEAERLRARTVQSLFSNRLSEAGIDDMRIAGMNAEFSTLLRAAADRGHESRYFTVQAWKAYEMAALVAFADANAKTTSILGLLGDLRQFDADVKGTVNRIATEQMTGKPRPEAIREPLDNYRAVLDKGISDPTLRMIVYHTSIPAQGIPYPL